MCGRMKAPRTIRPQLTKVIIKKNYRITLSSYRESQPLSLGVGRLGGRIVRLCVVCGRFLLADLVFDLYL